MRDYPYTIDNGAGEWLTFARRVAGPGGERVEGSVLAAPGAGPPMHVHFLQDEAFTVVAGILGYQVAGQEPALARAGETILFRAGEPHRFWNAGTGELHCTACIDPAGNAEFFLESLFSSQKTSGGRRPALFDLAYLTHRYRSEYRVMLVPPLVQKLAFPIVVVIGHLLGKYRKYAGAPSPLSHQSMGSPGR